MLTPYFYHEHIKKAVAVFGTLFNDIEVRKTDSAGKIIGRTRVPLSYGPRAKFMARIGAESNLNDPKLAIKLPRMSFEISGITPSAELSLNRLNRRSLLTEDGTNKSVPSPQPYRISFSLSIYSKNQDDSLQILEQILPFFRPEYTISIKELDGSFLFDMPFSIKSIGLSDTYEADFLTRRAIIQTLEFETFINFYGPVSDRKVIQKVDVDIANTNMEISGAPMSSFRVSSTSNSIDDAIINYRDLSSPDKTVLTVQSGAGAAIGQSVIGLTSATVGRISTLFGNQLTILSPDGQFIEGETLSINSEISTVILSVQNEWIVYET